MLAGACIILAVTMGLVLAAFTPLRRRLALPERAWLVGGGLVFPAVTLAALMLFGLAAGERLLPHAAGAGPVLRVEAVGRQWQWEFRYPEGGGGAATDRLYLPAGRPVDVHVSSRDVIHSFWLPRLAGKIDAVPGHVTVIRLLAREPGLFGGLCAEFCGRGHAGMSFVAEVLPAEEFDRLLAALAAAGATEGGQ